MAGTIFKDRLLETSTTTGTGSFTLAGALTGHQAFESADDGSSADYAAWAVDGSGQPTGDWETGRGIYTHSGRTLSRIAIYESSNSDAKVSWAAGTKRIANTMPASIFALCNPAQSRTLSQLSNRKTLTVTQPNGDYFVSFPAAGSTVTLCERSAGEVGMVTAVQMSMQGGEGSYDCRLRVYVDQEVMPSIDVDLGTLFVSHLDAHLGAPQSCGTEHIQMGVCGASGSHPNFTPTDKMCSYQMQFEMPYSDGIKIEIYTPATGVTIPGGTFLFSMVNIRLGVRDSRRLRSRGVTRLEASAASANLAASDIALMDVPNNAGWAVWFSTACFGATGYSYLERPHRYFIDGETGTSSFILTGGEEYGATGWYFLALARMVQPAVLLTATNNGNFTTTVGCDFLKLHGGIRFENELRLVHGNKTNYPAVSNHKMSWCLLYYVDTAVPFVPTAPQSLQAVAASGQITFTWAAPLSQGSRSITGYTLTLDNGGGSYSVAANVLTKIVTGLTNGVAYTGTVVATNAVGNSSASSGASATPTPAVAQPAAGSLALLGRAPTITVGAAGSVAPGAGALALAGQTPTIVNSGVASISDDFNRADNTTLGSTPVGSKSWASFNTGGGAVSEVGIESNRAYARTGTADGNCYAYVDTGKTDQVVQATLAVIGASPTFPGLVARVQDANNMVVLQADGASATAYSVYKKIAGSYTSLFSVPSVVPAPGDVLKLEVLNTNDVYVSVNGTRYGPYTASGISSTAPNAGFHGGTSASTKTTARWDNFSVL